MHWPTETMLTEEQIRAWQLAKSVGAQLTCVTITLLTRFPIERVRIHLREEIFLAKLFGDALWMEGCEQAKNAIEHL